jgi:hypothetical protein
MFSFGQLNCEIFFVIAVEKVKVWFQNRRMKWKRARSLSNRMEKNALKAGVKLQGGGFYPGVADGGQNCSDYGLDDECDDDDEYDDDDDDDDENNEDE